MAKKTGFFKKHISRQSREFSLGALLHIFLRSAYIQKKLRNFKSLPCDFQSANIFVKSANILVQSANILFQSANIQIQSANISFKAQTKYPRLRFHTFLFFPKN